MLIDIVKNVTAAATDYEFLPTDKHSSTGRIKQLLNRYSHNFTPPTPDMSDIQKLIDLIKESKKPLTICGGGVIRSKANMELKEFVTKIDSPVAITVMGAGGIEGRNKLVTGLIGMHRSKASNIACDKCDLLIALGCRFSDRVALNPKTFAKNAKIVQIDIDRAEINKNVKTYHHIIGDVKKVLSLLNENLPTLHHDEWKKEVFEYSTETVYDEENR